MQNDNLKELFDFANEVRALLLEKYEYVEVQKVVKNNDEILVGVTVRSESENVAPNVYLNDFYERFADNRMSMQDVSVQIQEIVDKSAHKEALKHIDTSVFMNKEELIKRVIVRLVGTDNNEQYLSSCVSVPVVEGLTAVLYVYVSSDEQGVMSSKLTKAMFDILDMPVEAVYQIAKRNTAQKLPCRIDSMLNVLGQMLGDDISDMDDADISMYVLSNNVCINGATAILYEDVLKDFCNEHGYKELYILTSSVHEVILVPKQD